MLKNKINSNNLRKKGANPKRQNDLFLKKKKKKKGQNLKGKKDVSKTNKEKAGKMQKRAKPLLKRHLIEMFQRLFGLRRPFKRLFV